MARLDSEPFKVIEAAITRHYNVVTVPTMGTGGTDMAFLRAKGVQCYGMGPARDIEDGPKGFGAHSDQERILESELHRFVRFHWDIVTEMYGQGEAPEVHSPRLVLSALHIAASRCNLVTQSGNVNDPDILRGRGDTPQREPIKYDPTRGGTLGLGG